jgi:hypothetical protein
MGILTEQVTTEDISILPDGTVKVRQKRVILDDGEVIFERMTTTALNPSDKGADSKKDALLGDVEARIAAANATVAERKKPKP